MSERRSDPVDLWREVTDAVASGARRSIDYQRSMADDVQRWFGDKSPRNASAPRDTSVRTSQGWTELRSGLTEYGSAVVELTADYYRDLAEVATRFVEQVSPRFGDGSRAMADYGPGGRRPQRAMIEVCGTIGDSVEARFSIENSDADPAEVLVETGICRGPDGASFRAAIELSADALVVAPHSSATIVATVDLTPVLFTPGDRYRLPISVHGPNPAIIDLEIAVDADRPAPSEREHDHTVRCPSCSRTFERTTTSLVLRPHHDDAGNPCPERDGERVR